MRYAGSIKIVLSIVAFAVFATVADSVPSAVAQPANEREAFTRAERLLPLLLEADSIEDPAMRVLIRYECLEFIYQYKIPAVHERADAEVLRFYAELTPEKRPVRYRLNGWQNSLLKLLRKTRPELASKIELAFLKDEDTSPAEWFEVTQAGNVNGVVDRIIEKMRRGVYLSDLPSIEAAVRRKDPVQADRLINAAFEVSEMPNPVRLPILEVMWHRPPESFEKWSPQLRSRYLRLIIHVVKASTGRNDMESVRRAAKEALNRNYENFRRYAPELVADAESLNRPDSLRAMGEFDRDASRRTIELSVDKVKQALIEAERATGNWDKYLLHSQAMEYAALSKEFARAVEISDVAHTSVSPANAAVDWDLRNRVLPHALSVGDLAAANSIISKINSDDAKAGALADLARFHARAKRSDEALKLVRQAYGLLDRDPYAQVPTTVIFDLVDPAFLVDSKEGFDAARRSIALANRLPNPKPDERIGGRLYRTYADHTLVPFGASILNTFRWMALKDIAAAETTEPVLKHRHWRILARLAIEKNRSHRSASK